MPIERNENGKIDVPFGSVVMQKNIQNEVKLERQNEKMNNMLIKEKY